MNDNIRKIKRELRNFSRSGYAMDEELAEAAYRGDIETVQALLDDGADPNANLHGYFPILAAVNGGSLEAVKLLVDAGADIDARTRTGTALELAQERGHTKIAAYLRKCGAGKYYNEKNMFGMSPLFRAARDGDKALVSKLLKQGANPNAADEYGITPLSCAVTGGYLDIVKLLVEAGANVNAEVNDVQTVLDEAIELGETDIVRYLRSVGAKTIDKDENEEFFKAVEDGNATKVKEFLEEGIDPNVKDKKGHSALYCNLAWGSNPNVDVVKALVEAGATVTEKIFKLAAYSNRNVPITKYLLSKVDFPTDFYEEIISGLKASKKEHCRLTSEDTIRKCHYDEIIELLNGKSNSAINKKDKFGNTALYYAARGGDVDEVKQLIKDGADVNLACIYDVTPLMVASKIDVLQALLDAGADINARGGLDDNTALAQAITSKETKKAEFLREHGAKE